MKVDSTQTNRLGRGKPSRGTGRQKQMSGIRTVVIGALLVVTPLASAQEAKPDPPANEPAAKQPEAPPAQPPVKPEDPAQPGAKAAADVLLKGVIRDAKGLVQVRKAADQPWEWAKKGMALEEGYQLRTGARSRVAIFFPPDENFQLDRLGIVTILRAKKSGVKVSIDLGMKYGRTRARIEAGGLEHETKIHAPSGTLAIRGSDGEILDDALGSYMSGMGKFDRLDRQGQTTSNFGRSGVVAKVTPDRPSAASVEQGTATTDPKGKFAARVLTEQRRAEQEPGTSGEDYREIFRLIREARSPSIVLDEER